MAKFKSLLILTLASTMAFAHGDEPNDGSDTKNEPASEAVKDIRPTPFQVGESVIECDELLKHAGTTNMNVARANKHQEALQTLKRELPKAFPSDDIENQHFYKMLVRLLTHRGSDKPSDLVVMAMTGAANMGKSTMGNSWKASLRGETEFSKHETLTPVDRMPGTTRRALIMIPRGSANDELSKLRFEELLVRFPEMKRMTNPDELKQPGPPLFVEIDGLEAFPNLVLVDTPDLTTGDINEDEDPVNLEAAREALVAADLVMVFMSEDNIRTKSLKEIINSNFNLFGRRNSVFFLKTSVEKNEDFDAMHGEVIAAARQIYGLPKDEEAEKPGVKPKMPKAVLKEFAIEDDKATGKTKHPVIGPFNREGSFIQFFEKVHKASAYIRGNAARAGAKAFHNQMRDKIDPVRQTNAALAAYQIALQGLLRQGPKSVDFPYDTISAGWRSKLSKRDGKVGRLVNVAAKVPTDTVRTVKAGSRKLFSWGKSAKSKSLDEVVQETDDAIKKSWADHFNSIARQLQRGEVTVDWVTGVFLMHTIEHFNEATPAQDRLKPLVSVDEIGNMTIQLPSREYLDAESQDALDQFFKFDFLVVLTPKVAPDVQKKRLVMTAERLDEQFTKVSEEQYPSHNKIRDLVSNALSSTLGYGGPMGGAAQVVSVLAPGAAVAAAPVAVVAAGAVAASTLIRLSLEGRIDADLRPILQEWFVSLQKQLFAETRDSLMGPLAETVNPQKHAESNTHLQKVIKALEQLDVFDGQGDE